MSSEKLFVSISRKPSTAVEIHLRDTIRSPHLHLWELIASIPSPGFLPRRKSTFNCEKCRPRPIVAHLGNCSFHSVDSTPRRRGIRSERVGGRKRRVTARKLQTKLHLTEQTLGGDWSICIVIARRGDSRRRRRHTHTHSWLLRTE